MSKKAKNPAHNEGIDEESAGVSAESAAANAESVATGTQQEPAAQPDQAQTEREQSTAVPSPAEQELARAKAQAEEYKGMAQRVQAEFENFRKRNAESVRSAREEGGNDAVIAFLPVLDTVEIALGMVTEEKALEGLKLIQKKACAVLEKFGVSEIEAAGVAFDPAFHNAVIQTEDPEHAGMVTEVLQKGYMRSGKVIRYAMVKVAK